YDDADQLIADSEVNAIYIATPPGSHKEYALKSCAAGKPVYVEKPMARCHDECQDMVKAFGAAGLKLFVAYYRRALPRFLKTKELVESGALGTVTGVQYRYAEPRHGRIDPADLPWRLVAAESGGGIRASVRDLRSAGEEALKRELKKRLDRMLGCGTTTVEAKAGYGLSTQSEILSLEIVEYWNKRHPIEIIPTFLGAHEVPDEFLTRRDEYVSLVVEEMLPQVAEKKLARFCDVFCEKGVFTLEQSQLILEKARKVGLGLKIHADEIVATGGAQLAVELGATSADHLIAVSPEGIKALSASRTVAALLPGTSYSLGLEKYAPARKLIDRGGIVALATDCNPGSNYCESMPMVISLACMKFHMSPAEVFSAATVNGAVALGLGNQRGQLVEGRLADAVVWDAQDYREIPYHYGVNLVVNVVKAGKRVI
ncbi:MAG: imidazolonepropionase, partial [candidate division Zixibacteria bacterium]|nr:imidazolonepropionase [candidate division Zixibacteria bacterium]